MQNEREEIWDDYYECEISGFKPPRWCPSIQLGWNSAEHLSCWEELAKRKIAPKYKTVCVKVLKSSHGNLNRRNKITNWPEFCFPPQGAGQLLLGLLGSRAGKLGGELQRRSRHAGRALGNCTEPEGQKRDVGWTRCQRDRRHGDESPTLKGLSPPGSCTETEANLSH